MDVRQNCCDFLQSQLHPTNCLGIRAFADVHTCTELLQQANAYAGEQNILAHPSHLEFGPKYKGYLGLEPLATRTFNVVSKEHAMGFFIGLCRALMWGSPAKDGGSSE